MCYIDRFFLIAFKANKESLPVEGCYLGWQESREQVAKLVGPDDYDTHLLRG